MIPKHDPHGPRLDRRRSHRLQRQWRTVDPEQIKEVAASLWMDKHLRALKPHQAPVQLSFANSCASPSSWDYAPQAATR